MRRAKTVLIMLLFSLILLGCNEKGDVKHLTQDEMLEYVQDRIGEEVALVSAIGNEDGDKPMKYVFNVVERDIVFEVSAQKYVNSLDGMRVGNYELVITIRYEQGVKERYQDESAKLAEKYNVEYKLKEYGGGVTTVGSYKDIDNLTDFIIELDKLYAFDFIDVSRSNPSVGSIVFADVGSGAGGRPSVSGLEFSRDSSSRLDRETLKEKIIEEYVISLKMRNCTDSAIPQDVWEKYSSDEG